MPLRLRHLAFAAIPLSFWPGLAPAQGKGETPEAGNPLVPRTALPPGAEQPLGLRLPRDGEALAAPDASDEMDAVAEEPPARVGRLSRVQGSVAFRQSPEEEWTPAIANTALVAGNALYTEPGARAAIQVNQIAIAIEGGTDLQIARLDDEGLIATLPRGSLDIQATGLLEQEKIEVVTAQGRLATGRDGRYLIDAGAPLDAPGGFRPARFSVLAGEAVVIIAEGIEQPLGAGQMLTLTAQGPVLGRIAAPPPLVAWAGGLGGKATQGTPVAARQMTGAEDLGRYGRWESAPEYGDIWYPTVEASYVPYRDGRWVWRDPWGWTWLDERPWGFAPFHYGRWVQVGPRWGWAPRPVVYAEEAWRPRRPVWAPALVAFVGVAALGPRGPGIGWVPLGPREAYYPAFRASPVYVRNVNLYAVRDPRALEGRWRDWRRAGPPPGSLRPVVFAPPPRADAPFINRAAFSALPAADMTASRPTRGRAQSISVSTTATPVLAAPPPPSGQTLGVTPVVAGRVGLPATTATATPRRNGPSPQTHVPLAAVVVPAPGAPRPAGPSGSGSLARPGAAPQAAPQSVPPGVAPPSAAAPSGLGTAGAVAAGAAAGLGAAAVLGRQPQGSPQGAPTGGLAPGGTAARPGAAAFGPAPGVAVQPGTGRFAPPPGGAAPSAQGFAPAPGAAVQPGTGRFASPPGSPGVAPAPGNAVQPGAERFTSPPAGAGVALPGRPGGPGLSNDPAATRPGTTGPSATVSPPGAGAARPGGPPPGLSDPSGGKPGGAPAQSGATGLRTPPTAPGSIAPTARPQQPPPTPEPGFRPQQAPQAPGLGAPPPRQPDPRLSQPAAPPPQMVRPQPSAAPPQQPAFRPPPPPVASPPPPQRQAAPPPPPPPQRQAAPPPPPPPQRQAAPPPPPPPRQAASPPPPQQQRPAAPPPPPPPRRPGDPPGR